MTKSMQSAMIMLLGLVLLPIFVETESASHVSGGQEWGRLLEAARINGEQGAIRDLQQDLEDPEVRSV